MHWAFQSFLGISLRSCVTAPLSPDRMYDHKRTVGSEAVLKGQVLNKNTLSLCCNIQLLQERMKKQVVYVQKMPAINKSLHATLHLLHQTFVMWGYASSHDEILKKKMAKTLLIRKKSSCSAIQTKSSTTNWWNNEKGKYTRCGKLKLMVNEGDFIRAAPLRNGGFCASIKGRKKQTEELWKGTQVSG